MKIGILTYHRSHNYGALLQAYALLTYLKGVGHTVEIIDYWPAYHSNSYRLKPQLSKRNSLVKNIKEIVSFVISFYLILKRRRGYRQFIKCEFSLPSMPRYKNFEALQVLHFDAVIYGSDQIWRKQSSPYFTGFNPVYFGAYPKQASLKIAYAASMGVIDVNSDDLDNLKQLVKNFNSVSVREDALKKLIEPISMVKPSLVLDPVFLLSKSLWFAKNFPRIKKTKYLLFYHLKYSEAAITLTNRLRDFFNIQVIEIRGRADAFLTGKRYCHTANPFEFLSLVKNAEFVVTTSFHGTAFSVIFEKQFYALGMGNNSDRVFTLLNSIGIENRLLTTVDNANFSDMVDYSTVKGKLEPLIEQSKNYLNGAINE